MDRDALDEVRDFWDTIAADWQRQVGEDGDSNRRLNSDPVLWSMLGDVAGRHVLDAGCGTGYLSRKMAARGARVVGVDLSGKMIDIARESAPDLDFRVDSVSTLSTLSAEAFDAIVSNYVLMDVPDLEGTCDAFHRVLRPGGVAVVVFSHPCFPQGQRIDEAEGGVSYHWDRSYFEPGKVVEPPWGHFTSDFIWFHRPLSAYWNAFLQTGFTVAGFEEPRMADERQHLASSPQELARATTRPYSVAFKLVK